LILGIHWLCWLANAWVIPIEIQTDLGYPTIAFRMTARVGTIENLDYLKSFKLEQPSQ
jgi:hypothetical protein